jgi:hypothetical protein
MTAHRPQGDTPHDVYRSALERLSIEIPTGWDVGAFAVCAELERSADILRRSTWPDQEPACVFRLEQDHREQ